MAETVIMPCNGKHADNEDKLLALLRRLYVRAKADSVTGHAWVKVRFSRGGMTGEEFEIVWSEKVA